MTLSTQPCPDCDGIGWFHSDNGPAPREYACEACEGDGVVDADEPVCLGCDGELTNGVCFDCEAPFTFYREPHTNDRIAA